jgi:beta-lactamase class D
MSCIFRLLILFIFAFSQLLSAQKITQRDFSSYFDKFGVKGCFVLFSEADNEYFRYNPVNCDSGYIPASTFKIPHAVIALEEDIVKDTSQVIKWDGTIRPVNEWNQDQTLKTSIKYSCVWVYEGFASRIPLDTYYKYIRSFDYGNKNLSGPPTRFWLAGSFRISANEQIEFLKKFYHYQLAVRPATIDIVKDCIILEKKDNYTLSGKTGGGVLSDTDYIMWLIGYVEKGNQVYYYAMNFRSSNFGKTASARYQITKEILKELGIL